MTLPQGSERPVAPDQPDPAALPEQPVAGQQVPAGQQMPGQAAAPVQPSGPGQPGTRGPQKPPAQHVVRRTRIGGVWVASALFALILLLLLIFILENSSKVSISFFGAHGHLPLGVALLLAAVLGVLLVAVPGSARILQLRRTARRHRKTDAKTAAAPPPSGPASGSGPLVK
jgi:putative membrane protein